MDALAVVGADDDVAERRAGLEDEDRISIATLGLAVACRGATVPLVQAAIECGTGRNGLHGGKGGGAG